MAFLDLPPQAELGQVVVKAQCHVPNIHDPGENKLKPTAPLV